MRDHEAEDPGKPRPVRGPNQKRANAAEEAEALPWRHLRKDDDHDRRRHVC